MGLTREQALECFASEDLIGIGMEADAVRRRQHPEGVVTYALNAYVDAAQNSMSQALDAAQDGGATGIVLYGCSGLDASEVEVILAGCSQSAPKLRLGMLESEVAALAADEDLLRRFHLRGLAWIEGDGAASSSVQLHRAAHAAGLVSLACLRFGAEQRMEDRVAWLENFQRLQQDTGAVRAFALRSASASTGRELDDPTAVEYLKTLAIGRMMLDAIDTVEANWDQQGLKVLQMALRFGANDTGSLLARGAHASEEEVRRLIRDAGFQPVQRDSLSTAMFFD